MAKFFLEIYNELVVCIFLMAVACAGIFAGAKIRKSKDQKENESAKDSVQE